MILCDWANEKCLPHYNVQSYQISSRKVSKEDNRMEKKKQNQLPHFFMALKVPVTTPRPVAHFPEFS